MTVTERFLRYIQVETTSDEASATCPSTPGQWDLARLLVDELQALGIKEHMSMSMGMSMAPYLQKDPIPAVSD